MGKPGAQRKSSGRGEVKEREKQIKVVYISNPVRVKTTAEEFKGVVQELTGRNSDIADRLSQLTEVASLDVLARLRNGVSISTDSHRPPPGPGNLEAEAHLQPPPPPRVSYLEVESPFDDLDELFTSWFFDDFASFPHAGGSRKPKTT